MRNRLPVSSETAQSSAIRECRRAALPLIVFSAGVNILMLTTALYMLQVYDRVLSSRSFETLVALTAIAIAALVTLAALEIVRARLLQTVGSWLTTRLSPTLLRSMIAEHAALSGSEARSGLRDLEQVRSFLTGPSVFPVLDAPWSPIFLAVIFLMHPVLGFVALGGGIVLFGIAIITDLATRRPMSEGSRAQASSHARADVAVRNAEVMQAMGMTSAFLERWSRDQETAVDIQSRAGVAASYLQSCARFVRMGLQVAILGVGAYLVLGGAITPGVMVAASIIMGRALAPVEQAIGAVRGINRARAAYGRLKQAGGIADGSTRALILPRPNGAVSAEKVTVLAPSATRPILKDISINLKPGESLGIIGPTAAGKTALARVLVGAWVPTSGTVRLDNMALSEWEADDRGRHVGYLPQDVELFGGSVREAISRFQDIDQDGVEDAVIRAAVAAGVHEVIKALPRGYETDIGEAGAILSGGQRQRIALARALYGDPALLVLDEPNSSLDREGEDEFCATMARLRKEGRTVVVVAHRSRVLESVDQILVMARGEIDLYGPRAAVLAQMGARAARQASAVSRIVPKPVSHITAVGESG